MAKFFLLLIMYLQTYSLYAQNKVHVKDYGAVGDGLVDDTSAIQKAINSGARQIVYGEKKYRVEGVIKLVSNQSHLGTKTTILRKNINNTEGIFIGNNVTNVTFKNFEITGSVNSKYNKSSAACIRFDNSNGIKLENLTIEKGTSGIQLYYSESINLSNIVCKNNKLTGISGIVKDIVLDNVRTYNNGYQANGKTHEIYFINSSNGVIRNSSIGNHNDNSSIGLYIRYDKSDSKDSFNIVKDWHVYNNDFYKNSVTFSSDSGVKLEERKPVKDIIIENNDFNNSANLQFDEPENCLSKNNKRINILINRVGSIYPNYNVSFISENDECKQISQGTLKNIVDKTKDKIIFKNTVLNNGNEDAVVYPKTFGGKPSLTLIAPKINGSGKLHNSEINKKTLIIKK